jgi:hypothetical protein
MARAIRLRRAGSARAVQPWACPTPWPGVGSPTDARRGTCWWRSGRAMSGSRRVPRTLRDPARRPAACPGGRPRRPGRIRASGSSAPVALGGAARSALGTPRRPQPAPLRSGRLSPAPLSCHLSPAPCRTSQGTDTGRGVTGRLVGAHFPDVAASTSSTARTIRTSADGERQLRGDQFQPSV